MPPFDSPEVFDLDFPEKITKIETLEEFVEQFKGISRVHTAVALYVCEAKRLYLQAYPASHEPDQYLKKRYFEEHLPKVSSLDRRTISEYRIAGKFIYEHQELIEQVGDIYQEGLLKKAYHAASIKENRSIDDVIKKLFALTKEQFIRYAHGEDISLEELSAQPKSKFEGFVKEYERLRSFFEF